MSNIVVQSGVSEAKRRKIGVLMGGMSAERDISLRSGRSILAALIKENYNAVAIDVDRTIPTRIIEEGIEVAFIALHGRYGEDGSIQGLLELLNIPYTGSTVTASAAAMNKAITKKILAYHNIPTPAFVVTARNGQALLKGVDLPVVVKPLSQGSTLGVGVVRQRGELAGALDEAFKYEESVMLEEFVEGRELTVSILNGRALPIIEIETGEDIYNFKAKYTDDETRYIVPARLPKEFAAEVKRSAIATYEVMECRGAARVDIVMDVDGRPYVLEINTIPGMTERSLLPMAAASAGIGFSALVEEILSTAIPTTEPDIGVSSLMEEDG
ncbi:MAG: D-alanine--D-alanine ligase [Thermodesulfobacteriota bacterium]